MKYLVKLIAVAVFVTLPWLSVSAAEPSTTKPQEHGSMHGMGQKVGMGMMDRSDEQLRAIKEHMLKMHDLMNRIGAAKDPAELDRLKEEHLQMTKAHHAEMMQHRQMIMQPQRR